MSPRAMETSDLPSNDNLEKNTTCEFDPSVERWRILKNVLLLGISFMLHFTAFFGISNLQSSINSDASLGTYTLASIYAALLLSNVFLPVLVIRWFGCKWTVALSFITYMPYIAAQFYPRFWTMIPAAFCVGLGGGPLWCAKCTYLTVISETYAKITGNQKDVIVVRFFGVFFTLYVLAQVWGNLISSAVLTYGLVDDHLANVTQTVFYDTEEICGANYCPGTTVDMNPNLKPPPEERIHLITGIFLGCMLAASILTAFGLDPLTRYNKTRTGSGTGLSGCQLLAVTVKQLMKPYQILLCPITVYLGYQIAFVSADWSVAFISCGWGVSNIGFVMMFYGLSNAFGSTCIGVLTKSVGRGPIIAVGSLMQIGLLFTLIFWKPNPSNVWMYYLISIGFGFAESSLLVTVNALSGILFPGNEEASYSNFRFWEAVGSVISYLLSSYLCTSTKLFIMVGLIFAGTGGYTCVQYMEHKKQEKIEKIEVSKNRNNLDGIDNVMMQDRYNNLVLE